MSLAKHSSCHIDGARSLTDIKENQRGIWIGVCVAGSSIVRFSQHRRQNNRLRKRTQRIRGLVDQLSCGLHPVEVRDPGKVVWLKKNTIPLEVLDPFPCVSTF